MDTIQQAVGSAMSVSQLLSPSSEEQVSLSLDTAGWTATGGANETRTAPEPLFSPQDCCEVLAGIAKNH